MDEIDRQLLVSIEQKFSLVGEFINFVQNLYVDRIYVFTHNPTLHLDWADKYSSMVELSNFPKTLLLQLTCNIAKFFMERGRSFLAAKALQEAWRCLRYAKKLEETAIAYNDSSESQLTNPSMLGQRRGQLNEIEKLIHQAQEVLRQRGFSVEAI